MKKNVNNFSHNVPTWLALADLKIDYYTQFIKSWIPLNAWYMVSYYDENVKRTSDRDIIDHLKGNSNPFRDRIINLLKGEDNISRQFKYELGQLHIELENHSIPNQENKLSFMALNISRNTKASHTHIFRTLSYKVVVTSNLPKGSKKVRCEIFDKTLSCIFWDELFEWSVTELNSSAKYAALVPERKEQLRACFEEVNPHKPINIHIKPTRDKNGNYQKPNRSITIDADYNIYFIDDFELISKVIIEMLYRLRCALFHGEINPTETNQVIYERAYNIQKVLIQELK